MNRCEFISFFWKKWKGIEYDERDIKTYIWSADNEFKQRQQIKILIQIN